MNTYFASTSVRTLMRTPSVALHPEQPLKTALNQLLDAGITVAPVTDKQHNLLGLVTEENILQAMWASDFESEALSDGLVKEIMQPATVVITSYSIHYTKLYDQFCSDGNANLFPPCQASAPCSEQYIFRQTKFSQPDLFGRNNFV